MTGWPVLVRLHAGGALAVTALASVVPLGRDGDAARSATPRKLAHPVGRAQRMTEGAAGCMDNQLACRNPRGSSSVAAAVGGCQGMREVGMQGARRCSHIVLVKSVRQEFLQGGKKLAGGRRQ